MKNFTQKTLSQPTDLSMKVLNGEIQNLLPRLVCSLSPILLQLQITSTELHLILIIFHHPFSTDQLHLKLFFAQQAFQPTLPYSELVQDSGAEVKILAGLEPLPQNVQSI